MKLIRIPAAGWSVPLAGAATCGAISWRAALLALGIITTCGALGLFTEWQRRKTFAELLKSAPDGTVIVQQDGPGGQVMAVTWGGSSKSAVLPPEDRS